MSAASLESWKFCWETVPRQALFLEYVLNQTTKKKSSKHKELGRKWKNTLQVVTVFSSTVNQDKNWSAHKGGTVSPQQRSKRHWNESLKNQVSSQHFAAEPCSLCCNVMIFEPQNVSHCAGFANIIELQLFQVFAGTTAKPDKIDKRLQFWGSVWKVFETMFFQI